MEFFTCPMTASIQQEDGPLKRYGYMRDKICEALKK